ncbi:MAG TPA: hypothetical protein EYO33_19040 [Phycisphaerales bacterium]|nr:hypothetical protein [Phycisphaerales bacterium]
MKRDISFGRHRPSTIDLTFQVDIAEIVRYNDSLIARMIEEHLRSSQGRGNEPRFGDNGESCNATLRLDVKIVLHPQPKI